MEIATYNFEVYQGNDDVYVLNIEEVDNEGNTTSANLTGYEFLLSIKDNPIAELIDALDTDNGYIEAGTINSSGEFVQTDANPYAIKIHFPHELTERLYAPRYAYDLFGIRSNDTREVLLKGDILVTRSISYGKNHPRHY